MFPRRNDPTKLERKVPESHSKFSRKQSIYLYILLSVISFFGSIVTTNITTQEDPSIAGAVGLFYLLLISQFIFVGVISLIFLPFIYRGKPWAMILGVIAQIYLFFVAFSQDILFSLFTSAGTIIHKLVSVFFSLLWIFVLVWLVQTMKSSLRIEKERMMRVFTNPVDKVQINSKKSYIGKISLIIGLVLILSIVLLVYFGYKKNHAVPSDLYGPTSATLKDWQGPEIRPGTTHKNSYQWTYLNTIQGNDVSADISSQTLDFDTYDDSLKFARNQSLGGTYNPRSGYIETPFEYGGKPGVVITSTNSNNSSTIRLVWNTGEGALTINIYNLVVGSYKPEQAIDILKTLKKY